MSLVQRFFFFFFFENFSLFLGKIWKSWIFFLKFFFFWISFWKYIHKQSTSNATWIFRIQRNIETWNELTNFKLNHDIANQMWSEAKLGHLLLLGPFRMLEAWWAWTLITVKWLELALGRHASCKLLAFDVVYVYTPLLGSSVRLRLIQETN